MEQNELFSEGSLEYDKGYAKETLHWLSIRTRVSEIMPGMVEKIERIRSDEYKLHLNGNVSFQKGKLWITKYYLLLQMMTRANLGVQMEKVKKRLDTNE